MDTWSSRDEPVLRAIVEIDEETGGDLIREPQIVEATGFDEETVQRALHALDSEDPPFFKGMRGMGAGVLGVSKVTGHARRAVGAWPTPETLADRLVAALQEAADAEEDEETRGRLRRTAAWLGGAGRDVLVQAAGTALATGAGIT